MSPICFKCPSFWFMKSIKRNIVDISEKNRYPIYIIKREILGQKVKVKKNDLNLLF